MNKIYIILLNYNGFNDTIECIKSINNNEKKANYEIIVVDNCSTDSSIKELEKIKNIKLIKNPKNNGFSAGNNLGIKYALENGAKYIMLLNNDTIVTPNFISNMYNNFNDNIDILGCRIMYYDKKDVINYNGGRINWKKGIVEMFDYQKKYDIKMKKSFYCDYITGCCMLIKKDVFDKIGLLPEEYFMYYEDVDFCVNAIRNGLKLYVDRDCYIYHKASVSSGGEGNPFAIKWNTRNRIIFMKKYNFKSKSFLYFYLTRIIVLIKYLIKGDIKKYKAVIGGIKDGRKYNKEKYKKKYNIN